MRSHYQKISEDYEDGLQQYATQAEKVDVYYYHRIYGPELYRKQKEEGKLKVNARGKIECPPFSEADIVLLKSKLLCTKCNTPGVLTKQQLPGRDKNGAKVLEYYQMEHYDRNNEMRRRWCKVEKYPLSAVKIIDDRYVSFYEPLMHLVTEEFFKKLDNEKQKAFYVCGFRLLTQMGFPSEYGIDKMENDRSALLLLKSCNIRELPKMYNCDTTQLLNSHDDIRSIVEKHSK